MVACGLDCASARPASSSSTESAGMSVSHSISVGRAPNRFTTPSNNAHTASADATAVVVDQDRLAIGIVHGVAGQVILRDGVARQRQPVHSIERKLVRRDMDVVGVEQQATAAAACQLRQELRFGHRRMREAEIAGRIFHRDLPAQSVLQPIDVAHHDVERFPV